MSKELRFVDDTDIYKYQDTSSTMQLVLSENGVPYNINQLDSVEMKIGNDNGSFIDRVIDKSEIVNAESGRIDIHLDQDVMNKLVPDDYNIELWASVNPVQITPNANSVNITISNEDLSDTQAIFPSDGELVFTIDDNVKAGSTDYANVYPIDDLRDIVDTWRNNATNSLRDELTNLLEGQIRTWQGDISTELKNELVNDLMTKSNEIQNTIQNVLGHSLEDELNNQAHNIQDQLAKQVYDEMVKEVAARIQDLQGTVKNELHGEISSELQTEINQWQSKTTDDLNTKLAQDIVDKTDTMKNDLSTDLRNILDSYFNTYKNNLHDDLTTYKNNINSDIENHKNNIDSDITAYKNNTTTDLNTKLDAISNKFNSDFMKVIEDKFSSEDSKIREDLSNQVTTQLKQQVTDTLHTMQVNGSIAVSKEDFDNFESKINNYVDSLKIASNVNEIIDEMKQEIESNNNDLIKRINVLSENKADKQDVDDRFNSIDLSSAVNESKTYTDTKVNKISSETQDGMNNIGGKLDQLLDVDKIKADVNSRVDNLDTTKADKSELSDLQNNVNISLNNKADKSEISEQMKNIDVSSELNQLKEYSNDKYNQMDNNVNKKLDQLHSQVTIDDMNRLNELNKKLQNLPSYAIGDMDKLETQDKSSFVNSINEMAKTIQHYYPYDTRVNSAIPNNNVEHINQYLLYNGGFNNNAITDDNYNIQLDTQFTGNDFSKNIGDMELTGIQIQYGFMVHHFSNNIQSTLQETTSFQTELDSPLYVKPENMRVGNKFALDFVGKGMNISKEQHISPRLTLEHKGNGLFEVTTNHGEDFDLSRQNGYFVYPYIKQISTYTVLPTPEKTLPNGTSISLVQTSDTGNNLNNGNNRNLTQVFSMKFANGYNLKSVQNGIKISLIPTINDSRGTVLSVSKNISKEQIISKNDLSLLDTDFDLHYGGTLNTYSGSFDHTMNGHFISELIPTKEGFDIKQSYRVDNAFYAGNYFKGGVNTNDIAQSYHTYYGSLTPATSAIYTNSNLFTTSGTMTISYFGNSNFPSFPIVNISIETY